METHLHILRLVGDHINRSSRPLVVIVGPTASGKTDVSIAVAEHIRASGRGDCEIVNADSRQLYKHLDIGTAKIRPEEMRGIPHHLLDVLDPKEEVTIAWYKERGMKVIDDILARGNVPMLVGGSMLYVSVIVDGLEPLPFDSAIRRRLEEDYDRDEGHTLHRKLADIDPEAAGGIPLQNKVYLVRAMELVALTGTKLSEAKRSSDCPYDPLMIGITRPKAELYERIRQRVMAMFDAGWVEEVRSLLARGYTADDPGLKSHGYREIVSHLLTGSPTREALPALIASKTQRYAKRQMTWWRHDERIQWVARFRASRTA
ncbi:MAG: tRNA dimethylallyltransferase [Candidatus Peregrinibacteria bacterium Greene0416_19]|nr:MAG: tRNA dimethylallyltransferase [Candidatus Peregrinibacteria bacterium Greene0416_19]